MELPRTAGATASTRPRSAPSGGIASTRSVFGVVIDQDAVKRAVEMFELKDPVTVKWSQGVVTRGMARWRLGAHLITVSTHETAEQVSVTIWHELVHAWQAERMGIAEFDEAYHREQRRVGYKRNKFEVEARDLSHANHRINALAHPA